MSANTAHANGGVLIYNGEIILLYCDGVELHFASSQANLNGTKKGRLYLTTHRMIFTNKSSTDALQSFSFPFFSMTAIELEQPIFGANFIKGKVQAQQGGNWTGEGSFKLKFMTGGAIEFGQAMLQAAKMASRYMPPQPPPYMPNQGPYFPAQPPAYAPPPGGFNGFVPPTHVFPDAPPVNSVYMSQMPPPYPGIYPPPYSPNPMGMAPGYGAAAAATNGPPPPVGFITDQSQGMQNGHVPTAPQMNNPKEQEAYAQTLQSPYNPHQVFMYGNQGQFDAPPPPYSEASKKEQ